MAADTTLAADTSATAETAADLAPRLARGELRAIALAEACLARIAEREEEVQAWAYHDPNYVRAQAEALDKYRASGKPVGPLHGLPVAVKDIVDTEGMPTENGTTVDAGRRPRRDALAVARLRAAGALVMGKATTTELAFFHPSKTRNPHDPAHTPGGSSAGSAAAVAAGMVPLAIGSQTNGSVIRPAAFCGIVGYKPTRGLIPTRGVMPQAPSLDTLGVFATSVASAALLADVLAGPDPAAGQPPSPPPGLLQGARAEPPLPPVFAMVRQPVWERTSEDTRGAFAELEGALGEQVDTVELPEPFAEGHAVHRVINTAEAAKSLARFEERGRDQLSKESLSLIDEGKAVLARDYLAALDWIEILNTGLDQIFDRYDAILTPAAAGEAPRDLTTTGDPGFCTLWTLCGTPAVTMPVFTGAQGMPMGLQLVGRRGDDARLLRTAAWLADHLARMAG